MNFKVLDIKKTGDKAEWVEIWNRWPNKEVHAHPAYVELYLDDKSSGYCAALESDKGSVIYPFIGRDISKEPYGSVGSAPLKDIITPYGYGGAFCWDYTDKPALSELFWTNFSIWAATANVVSEVVKFSLFPDSLLPYPGARQTVMNNIIVDLSPAEDALWMGFEHKVRKNVKKAAREGVTVVLDDSGRQLEGFIRIYHGTLDRRSAKDSYYFDEMFFPKLNLSLAGQYMYFHAMHGGEIISTELVLISADSVYSFLGGTRGDKFSLSPNDLLKYEIIKWAKGRGKKHFVLGGGSQPEDGVYRYKRSFAPGGIKEFQVGTRVLDKELYGRLIDNRRVLEKHNNVDWNPVEGFVPEYRTSRDSKV
jgi:hypothetical protein